MSFKSWKAVYNNTFVMFRKLQKWRLVMSSTPFTFIKNARWLAWHTGSGAKSFMSL